jgi:hypothetical protein
MSKSLLRQLRRQLDEVRPPFELEWLEEGEEPDPDDLVIDLAWDDVSPEADPEALGLELPQDDDPPDA